MWYQQIQCDISRYSVISADTVWYQQIQCDISRYSVISADTVWYQQIQCDISRYSVISADTVWYLVASGAGRTCRYSCWKSPILCLRGTRRWQLDVALTPNAQGYPQTLDVIGTTQLFIEIDLVNVARQVGEGGQAPCDKCSRYAFHMVVQERWSFLPRAHRILPRDA